MVYAATIVLAELPGRYTILWVPLAAQKVSGDVLSCWRDAIEHLKQNQKKRQREQKHQMKERNESWDLLRLEEVTDEAAGQEDYRCNNVNFKNQVALCPASSITLCERSHISAYHLRDMHLFNRSRPTRQPLSSAHKQLTALWNRVTFWDAQKFWTWSNFSIQVSADGCYMMNNVSIRWSSTIQWSGTIKLSWYFAISWSEMQWPVKYKICL